MKKLNDSLTVEHFVLNTGAGSGEVDYSSVAVLDCIQLCYHLDMLEGPDEAAEQR